MHIGIVICVLAFLHLSLSLNVVKLQGFTIFADPLDEPIVQGLSEIECADKCIDYGVACVGMEYSDSDGCKLLTQIRDIYNDSNGCKYYVIDRTGLGLQIKLKNIRYMMSLDPTDKLVFANAYYGNATCPQNFVRKYANCSLEMEESKCKEYAQFFNATFVGTECLIPIKFQSAWFCFSDRFPLFLSSNQNFCYFKTSSNISDRAGFIQACQRSSPKSYPLSICSSYENTYISSLTTEFPAFISNTNVTETCNYQQWSPNDDSQFNETDTETIVGLTKDKYFQNFPISALSTGGTFFCKENALSLDEYVSICETLDNCKQLN